MLLPDIQQAPGPGGTAGSCRFRDDEPVWREHPAGPRFSDSTWDLTARINRENFARRTLDFTTVPASWRLTIREILITFTQPDHPQVTGAGIVQLARPAPPETLAQWFGLLRTIARWSLARGAGTPETWTSQDAGALKAAAASGTHRPGGAPLAPSSLTRYIAAVKLLRERGPVLSGGGLTFEPWPGRGPAQVAGHQLSTENLTRPLPWDIWAAAMKAAWFIIDHCSTDILAAAAEAARLSPPPHAPTAAQAEALLRSWLSQGGRVPLHTGYGKAHQTRGTPNYQLLERKLGLRDNTFNRSARMTDLADAAASTRGQHGGLWTPSATVQDTTGRRVPWISELGHGELGFLKSVLRAAGYLLLTALTGMRDSEVQSLTRDAITTSEGMPALRGIQVKGQTGVLGRQRDWWAPRPVFRVIEVLAALSPHPQLLFATSASKHSPYQPHDDIQRFVCFTDSDPATRICRGSGLGLDPIQPASHHLNQSVMRRSFAIYASRYPAAELGLGIQLGHAALRMTAGYCTDSQQQATRLFDTERRQLTRQQVTQLTHGSVPAAGPGSKTLSHFHAQTLTDPQRADRLAASIASRYHLGLFNDCMWDATRAGCGTDHPKLAEGLCTAARCPNATFTPRHLPIIQDHISRIDEFLDTSNGHPDIHASLRTDRAAYTAIISELTSSPHHQESSQP
ncbi:MAG TPA: hypothetical protein VGI74_24390 [Streptosporangiaceae bacterium]|jgi:integrase